MRTRPTPFPCRIRCWEGSHIAFAVFGIVALVLYYLCTLIEMPERYTYAESEGEITARIPSCSSFLAFFTLSSRQLLGKAHGKEIPDECPNGPCNSPRIKTIPCAVRADGQYIMHYTHIKVLMVALATFFQLFHPYVVVGCLLCGQAVIFVLHFRSHPFNSYIVSSSLPPTAPIFLFPYLCGCRNMRPCFNPFGCPFSAAELHSKLRTMFLDLDYAVRHGRSVHQRQHKSFALLALDGRLWLLDLGSVAAVLLMLSAHCPP